MTRTLPLPRLSEAEGGAWSGFLRAHALIRRKLDADLRGRSGLTLSEFEILLHIAWAGGERRMAQIARDVVLTGGGVTRIVVRLEKLGLIERRSCPGDGRGVFAVMTEAGWAKHRSAHATHLEGVRRWFFKGATGDEVKVVGRVFGRIAARPDRDHTSGDACETLSQGAPRSPKPR